MRSQIKDIAFACALLLFLVSSCIATPTEAMTPTVEKTTMRVPIHTKNPTVTPQPTLTATNTPSPIQIEAFIGSGLGQNDLPPFRVIMTFQGPGPEKDFPNPPELADFDIAAGLNSVLAVSNFGIGLYTKSGNLLEYQTIQDFFKSALLHEYESYYANSQVEDGEIRSLYDPLSERYFIVASTSLGECNINACISYFMLAVSKSNEPGNLSADDWYLYAFDGSKFGDDGYPRMVDFTEVTVTESVVALTCQCVVEDEEVLAGNIPGIQGGIAKILLLPKDDLIRGQQPEQWNALFGIENPFNPRVAIDQLEPVILQSGNPSLYFLYHTGTECSIAVLQVDNPLGTPQALTQIASASGNCSSHDKSPQPNGFPDIKTLASPLSARPLLVNGSIWGVQNIDHPQNSQLSAIRWYQIDVSQWPGEVRFIQDNIYAIDNLSIFYSAPTVNTRGDVMLVFGSSGETSYPSLYVTGRLNDDPSGTMRPSVLIAEGKANYDVNSLGTDKYGDYFGITLDPVDNSVWAYGQYTFNSCRWASMIAQLDWDNAPIDLVVYQEGLQVKEPRGCGPSIEGLVQSLSEQDLANYSIAACPVNGGACQGFPLAKDNTFRLILSPGSYYLSVNPPDNSPAVGWYSKDGLDVNGQNSTAITVRDTVVDGIEIIVP
jgi:hypothetical protein